VNSALVHAREEPLALVSTGLSEQPSDRMAEPITQQVSEQGAAEGYDASGHATGLAKGYENRRRDGVAQAVARYRLSYPCSVCQQPIQVRIDGPEVPI